MFRNNDVSVKYLNVHVSLLLEVLVLNVLLNFLDVTIKHIDQTCEK